MTNLVFYTVAAAWNYVYFVGRRLRGRPHKHEWYEYRDSPFKRWCPKCREVEYLAQNRPALDTPGLEWMPLGRAPDD